MRVKLITNRSILKEINIFKNRFLIVIGVVSLLLVTMAVSSPRSSSSPTPDLSGSDFHQRHPDWIWAVKQQNAVIPATGEAAFPDYYQRHRELSVAAERSIDTTDYYFRHPAANTSSLVGSFSAEQIHREYILGERYGETPQGYAQQQALREAWLGERYGQTPYKP